MVEAIGFLMTYPLCMDQQTLIKISCRARVHLNIFLLFFIRKKGGELDPDCTRRACEVCAFGSLVSELTVYSYYFCIILLRENLESCYIIQIDHHGVAQIVDHTVAYISLSSTSAVKRNVIICQFFTDFSTFRRQAICFYDTPTELYCFIFIFYFLYFILEAVSWCNSRIPFIYTRVQIMYTLKVIYYIVVYKLLRHTNMTSSYFRNLYERLIIFSTQNHRFIHDMDRSKMHLENII